MINCQLTAKLTFCHIQFQSCRDKCMASRRFLGNGIKGHRSSALRNYTKMDNFLQFVNLRQIRKQIWSPLKEEKSTKKNSLSQIQCRTFNGGRQDPSGISCLIIPFVNNIAWHVLVQYMPRAMFAICIRQCDQQFAIFWFLGKCNVIQNRQNKWSIIKSSIPIFNWKNYEI